MTCTALAVVYVKEFGSLSNQQGPYMQQALHHIGNERLPIFFSMPRSREEGVLSIP